MNQSSNPTNTPIPACARPEKWAFHGLTNKSTMPQSTSTGVAKALMKFVTTSSATAFLLPQLTPMPTRRSFESIGGVGCLISSQQTTLFLQYWCWGSTSCAMHRFPLQQARVPPGQFEGSRGRGSSVSGSGLLKWLTWARLKSAGICSAWLFGFTLDGA